jgi:hypothetical protein
MTDQKVWFITDAFRDLSASLALDDLQPTGNRR